MKIYLDTIFVMNFGFDFLLLLGVSYLLRRSVSLKRIALGALVGGLSIFTLFLKINSTELFFLKIMISILMVLITFSYRNWSYTAKNLFYLYSSSMILGGVLYALNVQFSYQQKGLIFYHNGLSINFILLLVSSPIIIYAYVKQGMLLKTTYSHYQTIQLYFHKKKYQFTAFVDTGNRLTDPYFHDPIVIIEKDKIPITDEEYILVPIHTIKETSLLKCIRVDKLVLKDKIITKFWLGLSEEKIKMEGIDCLLQPILMEEFND